jgi:hypothetical protein
VQVDSRLHFLRRRHLIPGGQHGEEEKEGSGEEDEASEEEVRVLPLWNLRQLSVQSEIASHRPARTEE